MAVGLHSAMVVLSRGQRIGRALSAATSKQWAGTDRGLSSTRSAETITVGCEAALIEIAENQIEDYRSGMLIGTVIIVLSAFGIGLAMLLLSSL